MKYYQRNNLISFLLIVLQNEIVLYPMHCAAVVGEIYLLYIEVPQSALYDTLTITFSNHIYFIQMEKLILLLR